MDKLEMIKAFAKLDGVEVERAMFYGEVFYVYKQGDIYDPISDLALNCAARDKYEVELYYYDDSIINLVIGPSRRLDANSKEEIPLAVIECILKSKGLWNEQ